MRGLRSFYRGLVLAGSLVPGLLIDADPSGSVDASTGAAPANVTYQVALINKSMTGDWGDERDFRKHVEQVFGVSKVFRFKLRGEPLQDWLDEESPSVAKVICLIDGWTSTTMTRVDVRGAKNGQPLKEMIKVEKGDWKAALARAKQYVETAS